jgi:hypothetical protein
MVISRSSIPQQIMKPGVKKMKKGRKTRRNTTPATKDIKKSLSKAKKRLEKEFETENIKKKNLGTAATVASFLIPKYPYFAETLLKPTKAGAATLFTDKELKELKKREKENEKSVKKYMGGSLNKRRK